MNVYENSCKRENTIRTVDMHTGGEPTRIVLNYPGLSEAEGRTLLKMRAYATERVDWVRKRLMFEPRGHGGMYGAVVVPVTEEVKAGRADVGVLFLHNEGYSTMCGHATIALGKFLVDTRDERLFPMRRQMMARQVEGEEVVMIRIHAPCGVVRVSVPIVRGVDGEAHSNPQKGVSFLSVPSFVSRLDEVVDVPEEWRWNRFRKGNRSKVVVDIAYGGAFYAIVPIERLGWEKGELTGGKVDLMELREIAAVLKRCLSGKDKRNLYTHPTGRELEYLYGVIVTDEGPNSDPGSETSVCYFAEEQTDRSPTGSGVCARVALAMARGTMELGGARRTYSVVSKAEADAFVGTAVEVVPAEGFGLEGKNGVRVKVEGRAFYTGAHAFVVEDEDALEPFLIA